MISPLQRLPEGSSSAAVVAARFVGRRLRPCRMACFQPTPPAMMRVVGTSRLGLQAPGPDAHPCCRARRAPAPSSVRCRKGSRPRKRDRYRYNRRRRRAECWGFRPRYWKSSRPPGFRLCPHTSSPRRSPGLRREHDRPCADRRPAAAAARGGRASGIQRPFLPRDHRRRGRPIGTVMARLARARALLRAGLRSGAAAAPRTRFRRSLTASARTARRSASFAARNALRSRSFARAASSTRRCRSARRGQSRTGRRWAESGSVQGAFRGIRDGMSGCCP